MPKKRVIKPKYKRGTISIGQRPTCQHCGKRFVTKFKDQQVCGFRCCFEWYQTLGNKGRATARALSFMVGRKSMAEVEFDMNHEALPYVYEPDTFLFMPTVKESKYTPDYRFPKKVGGHMYIEFKGKLDLSTRKRLLDVKKNHPKLDLRLVFKLPGNKISKASKTTYYQWAVKHGFLTSETNCMPAAWKKEIKT